MATSLSPELGTDALRPGPVTEHTRAVAMRHTGVDLAGAELRSDAHAERITAEERALAVAEGDTIHARGAALRQGGPRMIAHELVHLAQQGAARTNARQPYSGAGGAPAAPDGTGGQRGAGGTAPVEAQRAKEAEFMAWYEREKANMAWLEKLPGCPCTIDLVSGRVYGKNPVNPDETAWEEPTSWLWGYHQGAEWCMRSRAPSETGAGDQCCYDDAGRLITAGSGAGTADKATPQEWYSELLGWSPHQSEDVKWADVARELDEGRFGRFSQLYVEVRPPNNKKNCPENEVAEP